MVASKSEWEPLWLVVLTPDELAQIDELHTCTPKAIDKGAYAGMYLLKLWNYEWDRVKEVLPAPYPHPYHHHRPR